MVLMLRIVPRMFRVLIVFLASSLVSGCKPQAVEPADKTPVNLEVMVSPSPTATAEQASE